MLEDIEVILVKRQRKRRCVPRIPFFIEHIVARYNEVQFHQDFRITRTSFEHILQAVAPLLMKDNLFGRGRHTIRPEQQLLSVLWLLSTPDSYRSVSGRFNMGKSSLSVCFFRVVKALNELAPRIIEWPNQDRRIANVNAFYQLGQIDGIVGVVDGTYIPIKAPTESPHVYINRKCYYGITLQAMCDADLKFIDCFVGYPSSVSDARIFRQSDIYRGIMNNREAFLTADQFIVGDKIYPHLPWCITPYRNLPNTTAMQRHFNKQLAKSRQVIERAFALLFGRFRRLRYVDMNVFTFIPATVIACCVLHNICLLEANEFLTALEQDGNNFVYGDDGHGIPFQEQVLVGNVNQSRRDSIAEELFMHV